ncbi:hypothetical protein DLEV_112 [Diachasmimorpha longicaudata entomopoxvirus]|uniref:Uncharacterized protein n=1 Tax=Diachasmimorpha longicaudata entomopoxvirus TaxID=109981 RepID=A0A7R5WJB8_9POXV|nr:hypothetical protein QKK69_gp112 [Diachasmimorpha longicaudata entomopoxvirus]AKS26403.1 hypothetical protein DLEV_112 [Diachasmimorpha longicaudata entomopoxvirus]
MSIIQLSPKILSILPPNNYSDFHKKLLTENTTRQLVLFQSYYFKVLKNIIHREIENHNQIVNFKNILAEYNTLVRYYSDVTLNALVSKITLQDIKNKNIVEKITDEKNQVINFSQIGNIQPSITSDQVCAVFDSQFIGLMKLKRLKLKNKFGFYFLTTDNKLVNYYGNLCKKSFVFSKNFDFLLNFILEPLLAKNPEFDIISLVIGLTFKNITNKNDFLDNIYFNAVHDLGDVNFTIYNVIYQNSTANSQKKTTFALPEFKTQLETFELNITLPKLQKCSEKITYVAFSETGHVHIHYPNLRQYTYNKQSLTQKFPNKTDLFVIKLRSGKNKIQSKLSLKRIIYSDILNDRSIYISGTQLLYPFLIHTEILEHPILLEVKSLNSEISIYNLEMFTQNDLLLQELTQIMPHNLDWMALQKSETCFDEKDLLSIFKKKYNALSQINPLKAQTFKKMISRFTIEELLSFKGQSFFKEYYEIIKHAEFIWNGEQLLIKQKISDKYHIVNIVYNIKLFLLKNC